MRPTDPRLVRRLRPAFRPLVVVLGAGVVAGALTIAQAWIVAGLVVGVVDGTTVRPWAVALIGVFAARATAGVVSDVAAARAAGAVGSAIRRDLIGAVLAPTGPRTLRNGQTGEVAVLVTRGVAAAQPYLTRYLPALVLGCLLPPLAVVAMATQDPASAVIVLATLPLVPVFGVLVGLAARDQAERQWRAMGSLSGHFLDVMVGLPTLVAFRRAEAQTSRIREVTDRYRRASMATLKTAFASSAVLELVATLSVALVAVTVGLRVANGHLGLHPALVVLLLAPEAYWPLRRVGAEFHAAAEGVATFERVDALLSSGDTDDTSTRLAGPQRTWAGDLVVDRVTVRYPGRGVSALDRLSVEIPATGLTAVIGPSGCGKSTLLSVLAGLRAPDDGEVRVEGSPATGQEWREHVSLLPQRPVFVAGTVADNIRLGSPQANDAEVWTALATVSLDDRVRALPDGLDTPIDEDGEPLSAGERARLALARIVVSRRRWVLLDEPTAHLDSVTEAVVAGTLVDLARDRSVVVVTHRPELVAIADQVIDLPAGAGSAGSAGSAATGVVRRGKTTSAAVGGAALPGVPVAGPPPRSPRLWAAALVGGVASAAGVALTATSGWLIVQASTQPPILTLLVAVVAVRTFGLARPTLRYAERTWSHDGALRLLMSRRAGVYQSLVPLTPGRLGPRRGDLLASVVDDVDSVLDRELRDRIPMRGMVLVGVLATALASLAGWRVGLVVAAVTAAGFVAYAAVRARTAAVERAMVTARADLSTKVVEAVQVADELVMWQAGDRAVAEVANAGDRQGACTVRGAWALGTGRGGVLLACGCGAAAAAVLVAAQVTAGSLGAPVAALLVLTPLALADVLVGAPEAGAASARARAAQARLDALLSLAPAVTPPREPVAVSGDPTVDVVAVTAGWDVDRPAFEELTVRVPPGARVGVMGRSGSGKSTLAALILRFLDPVSGTLSLGGVGLTRLDLAGVRGEVGLVDDDPHVFATSLVENVRLARPTATDGEVEGAVRAAGLGPWLDDLADGLGTRLGDGAAGVSGGERARLAVARSLLADQPVLVLDEPTAHLDHATAELLAEQVLSPTRDRSVIWMTHEPVGLDRVDVVVNLDDHATSTP